MSKKKEVWQDPDNEYLNCIGVGDTYVKKQIARILNQNNLTADYVSWFTHNNGIEVYTGNVEFTAAKTFRSDWREKCCNQCKYKFVEYKGKQHQCGFSKCTDEEVAEFNEHNGCQGIREYLETGVFPERGRK